MAINFIPFEELFATEYQLNYISSYGYIIVGPYTYNVFFDYTVAQRQAAFQACEKYLPWEISEEQEHWELAMYMYQWVIKSPPPFPYLEYTLSEDIMAVIWEVKITSVNLKSKRGSVTAIRTDSESALPPHVYVSSYAPLETLEDRVAVLDTIKEWETTATDKKAAIDAFIDTLEQTAKTNLEEWELSR